MLKNLKKNWFNRMNSYVLRPVFLSLLVAGLLVVCGCDDGGDTAYVAPLAANITANAPLASEEGENAEFTVTLTKTSASDVTVTYTVSGTAIGSDHNVADGSITIAAGDTIGTIPLIAVNDFVEEGDETVVLTLAPGTGYIIGGASTANATISANDTPVATIVATDAAANEFGNPGSFTITLSTTPMESKIINLNPTGTATSGTDYEAIPGMVTIAAGETSKIVTVTPINDNSLSEGTESVELSLASGTGYWVGTLWVDTVMISDGDVSTVFISAPSSVATEDGDFGAFFFWLDTVNPLLMRSIMNPEEPIFTGPKFKNKG